MPQKTLGIEKGIFFWRDFFSRKKVQNADKKKPAV